MQLPLRSPPGLEDLSVFCGCEAIHGRPQYFSLPGFEVKEVPRKVGDGIDPLAQTVKIDTELAALRLLAAGCVRERRRLVSTQLHNHQALRACNDMIVF